ncbi:hypothetical protein PBI_MORRISSEY_43 [Gordonia phage Morrissey]|nr:hypothetical protein PBI_MORRISSEY_43 [Gordonia phage Morrissey]
MSTNPTLYQFVSARLPEDLGTNLRDHAKVIVTEIPAESVEEYLTQAVFTFLADAVGARRRRALDRAQAGDPAPESREEVTEESTSAVQPTGASKPSATPPVQNRRRQDRHRGWWRDLLAQRGLAADGGHKLIAAMTAEDLRANIDHREALARENVARADQFRRLLKLLEESDAATVGQIKVRDVPDNLAA